MPVKPDLRCLHHPHRPATGQCDRCGDMLCGECIREYMLQSICPACEEQLRRPHERYVRLDAGLVIMLSAMTGLIGIVVLGGAIGLQVFGSPSSIAQAMLLIEVGLAAPLALALVARQRRVLSSSMRIAIVAVLLAGIAVNALALALATGD